MDSGPDPVWTTQPELVSRENPLDVTTTRNRRLFNDLLHTLLSDSITYRLRYVSFWAWCLDNHDKPTKSERARYEKVFFFATLSHDCPDHGHFTNGIVGASRTNNANRYDSTAASFDITTDAFDLTGSGGSGFDQYYQSLMHRLWLLDGALELTPLGRRVADAFDTAVSVDFEEVRAAVTDGRVSHDLVESLAADGCCCLLRESDRERELLTAALLSCISRTHDPEELAFEQIDGADAIAREAWYPAEIATASDAVSDIDSMLADDADETDLGDYHRGGFGARARASILLILGTAARVQRSPASTGWDIPALQDIRRAWQLFVHTHYFVIGCEALLKAWLHAVRAWEPISTAEVLTRVFDAESYRQTVWDVATNTVDVTVDDTTPDRRWRVLDAIYYGDWYDGAITAEYDPTAGQSSSPEGSLTWAALTAELSDHTLDTASARVIHSLLRSGDDTITDGERAIRIAGYATVLLAQLRQWRWEHLDERTFEPYLDWFTHRESSPGPSSFWHRSLTDSDSVGSIMQSVMEERTINTHQRVTRRKIRDRPSLTPRHVSRRPDGKWEFKSMYTTTHLGQSWARLKRLTDALFELGLTTTPDLDEFEPTDRGHHVLNQYGINVTSR